jgi:hypothetical protein
MAGNQRRKVTLGLMDSLLAADGRGLGRSGRLWKRTDRWVSVSSVPTQHEKVINKEHDVGDYLLPCGLILSDEPEGGLGEQHDQDEDVIKESRKRQSDRLFCSR